MSYIDLTRRNLDSAHENTVCLTRDDCRILLPFFKKIKKQKELKYIHYKDLHEGGEATEKQVDKMMEYGEQFYAVDGLINECNKLLNK